jgi:[pyruvate, water dikinase]-phosphate phosphotransferase / [pyruvate, water dikinase] kinase
VGIKIKEKLIKVNLSPILTDFHRAHMLEQSYFHLHLVSDATGETLMNVARAVSVQFENINSIEHMYPLIRNFTQLDRALNEIEAQPGIVLYTLIEKDLIQRLEDHCFAHGCPCLNVLEPVNNLMRAYLGAETTAKIGAQHTLNADYFKRIDALNFTLLHDDGHLSEMIEEADVLLIGVSRSSKTPTSIYLANRGIKTANIPLVPHIPLPEKIFALQKPLIVGLIASSERIVQIRENRVLTLNATSNTQDYIDKEAVQAELLNSRKLFAKHNWPVIDVSRRSIEETAAAIMALLRERK